MTSEISGFFYDATSAKYDPLTWQRPYRGIIGNGIVKNPPSDLGVNTGAVTALGSPNMSVNVDTMQAWMQGFWYRNPAVINLTITAAHPSLPRIDRVVLTLSVTGTAPYYAGSITVSVITGTPAASPVAPSLIAMSDTGGQMAIADIAVAAGATQITSGNITDDRGTSVCFWVGLKSGVSTSNADGSRNENAQVHYVSDPTNALDAANQEYVLAQVATTPPWNIFGNANLGAVVISGSTSWSGLKQCSSLAINNGVTLTLTGPTVILCTGTVTINGAINGVGLGCAGGAAVSTSSGGVPGIAPTSPPYSTFAQGVIGGFATGAPATPVGPPTYTYFPAFGSLLPVAFYMQTLEGVEQLIPLFVSGLFGDGEGGSSGNATTAPTGGHLNTSGAGGAGSPSLIIIAKSIIFAATGTINLSGASGGNASQSGTGSAGGGTGGNGGNCIFCTRTLTNSGTFTSNGGAPGTGIGGATSGNTAVAGALYTIII